MVSRYDTGESKEKGGVITIMTESSFSQTIETNVIRPTIERVGLSMKIWETNKEMFEAYQRAGITDMELENGNQTGNDADYRQILDWAKQYGVKLWSYHLPFEPRKKICTSKRECQTATLELYSDILKRASDIGIDKFVIHPSSEPIEEHERGEQKECAKENLAKLAEVATRCGAVLAVENMARTCLGRNSEELLDIISVHPALRVCYDTNHLFGEDIQTFIRKMGDKIITIHVSDCDSINERHWLPGEGHLDWQVIYQSLKEVGYNGPWLYEVGLTPPPTIERRKLELCDFVNNANEIFAGNIPIPIGKKKKNLGMWGVKEDEEKE